MKAFIATKYGPAESSLQLKEVDRPSPGEGEVLVEVKATSINPADWRLLEADPWLVKLDQGFSKPKKSILGHDIAGVVVEVGKGVRELQTGDKVYGEIEGGGGFGEYLVAKEDMVSKIPGNLSFVEAAAVPMAAFTSLQGLEKVGQIRKGEKVLINGASGGLGTYAVQIAKAYDCEVTGVCSTGKVDYVKALGADVVIDYRKEDFTGSSSAAGRGKEGSAEGHGKEGSATGHEKQAYATGHEKKSSAPNHEKYDLVFDTVGNFYPGKILRAVKPGGRCVVAGFSSMTKLLAIPTWGKITGKLQGKKILNYTSKPSKADLQKISGLIESGKIKPHVDRVFPFAQIPEAIIYQQSGKAAGKVVVKY